MVNSYFLWNIAVLLLQNKDLDYFFVVVVREAISHGYTSQQGKTDYRNFRLMPTLMSFKLLYI